MAEKKKIYPNPKFGSREEEERYWATHSPLDEGYAREIQKEKQKRSSFLTIRLTGEELTELRDLAAAKGMGPSTFIRTLIKDTLGPKEQTAFALCESEQRYQTILSKIAHEREAAGLPAVKDKTGQQYKVPQEAFCILKLSKVPITLEKMNELTEVITFNVFDQIISNACIKVVTPDDAEFDKLKRITAE